MLDTPFYCAAGQIKTPAFLFDRAAQRYSRICGIFFALTPEISLATVTFLLRTANARHGRAHQSDASARIFCVLRRVFWSPQGHLVGDAASGRACILCAPVRSKERGASSQNLRTSAPFVALRGFPQVMGLMSSTELIKCFKFDLSLLCPTYANDTPWQCCINI